MTLFCYLTQKSRLGTEMGHTTTSSWHNDDDDVVVVRVADLALAWIVGSSLSRQALVLDLALVLVLVVERRTERSVALHDDGMVTVRVPVMTLCAPSSRPRVCVSLRSTADPWCSLEVALGIHLARSMPCHAVPCHVDVGVIMTTVNNVPWPCHTTTAWRTSGGWHRH